MDHSNFLRHKWEPIPITIKSPDPTGLKPCDDRSSLKSQPDWQLFDAPELGVCHGAEFLFAQVGTIGVDPGDQAEQSDRVHLRRASRQPPWRGGPALEPTALRPASNSSVPPEIEFPFLQFLGELLYRADALIDNVRTEGIHPLG